MKLLALLAATLFLAGCAPLSTYRYGNDSLYPQDIHTVYVPMFESDSFRPHLGQWLTEAVAKEIELKTDYKLVGTPGADSVLSGRITSDTKRVVVENRNDDPRETEYNIQVQVVWARRDGGILIDRAVPLPPAILEIGQSASVVPEYGESIATGQQEAIQKLAEQIVAMMEAPW